MNKQIIVVGKRGCNIGQMDQGSNTHLPVELWGKVLVWVKISELGRARTCCHMFNDIAENCMKELVLRELQAHKNPLDYICEYPNRKIKEFFDYYIEHAILTQELLKNVLKGSTKAYLLALCDMAKQNDNNIILMNNIEIMNSSFGKCRYFCQYWNHLDMMMSAREYDFSFLACYVSLNANALLEKKK